MPITALYAAALAVLFLILAFRTISARRGRSIEIGDGGDRELLRRIRVHANFAEYVPLALLLLALAESLRPATAVLHLSGGLLLLGRLIHAYGLSQTPHILRLRVLGMVMTITAIAVAAITCATLALPAIAR